MPSMTTSTRMAGLSRALLRRPSDVPPAPNWAADLGARCLHFFPLKLLGTTLVTWLFFVGYFHLLRFPAHAVTTVPVTALDRLVPFQPGLLIPYLSLWVYVGTAPGLQATFRELLSYGVWACVLLLAGLGLFWMWPTQVPPATYDAHGFPGFELMRGIDAAGNACPSMHVAIAIYTAIWMEWLLRKVGAPRWLRGINAAWFVAIAYSTLALKQHVVVDVVAGAVLGGAIAVLSLRHRPR